MDIATAIRNSWHITWKNWPLWALAVLMFVAFIPAGTLSMAFTTFANAISFNDPTLNSIPEWQSLASQLKAVPPLQWIGLAVVALILLVITTAITFMLQAASMRGVVMAAEGNKVALMETLRLGRSRAINIVKLSGVFGILSALIGVLPSLALLLIGDQSPLGVALVHLAQTGLTPITLVLNILVLLLIMSIAIEDFTPRAAFGRAGNVFKKGWWAFIVIFSLSGAAVLVSALIMVIPVLLVIPVAFISPEAGLWLTLASCTCGGFMALFFFLFTVVFTQALYALVYREAARLTANASA